MLKPQKRMKQICFSAPSSYEKKIKTEKLSQNL